MEYQPSELLTLLGARSLNRPQAKELFRSYLAMIPSRILILERAVQTTAGLSEWVANNTRDSLQPLGLWFSLQIETRQRTAEEMKAIYTNAPSWMQQVTVEDWELSSTSFSIAIDIGMYMAESLRWAVPALKWKLITTPTNDISFHQPVLAGASKAAFNPTHIITTLAYAVARKVQSPDRLQQLFDIWANLLSQR
jgi:hypothetical protein